LANALNLQTNLRLSSPAEAGAGSSRALIGGLVDADPIIGFAFPVDWAQARQVSQRLEGRAHASSEFELQVRNARGETC
jgi:hypothetical protein